MFNKFDEDVKQVIAKAKVEMIKLKHPYLGSEHLVLGILKDSNIVSNALKKYNINYKIYYNEVVKVTGYGTTKSSWILYTPVVKEIFDRAIDISLEENSNVTLENFFVAIIEIGGGIAEKVFNNLNIDIDKLYSDFIFRIPKSNKKKKNIIDEIGYEFTKKEVINTFEPVIGREKEITSIIEVLTRKKKSNPLLVGDAGVGKTAIIEEISSRIINNKVPNKLKGKRIINIDMSVAVAGTKYRGEFEEKINKIIKCAEEDENIILFIDEIHTIVGAGGAEGAIDASNILKPALARGKIKCIGATTLDEYKNIIEKDKALERRFKKIIIDEPDINQVKQIIYKLKTIYEKFHHVKLNKNILESIIELSNKYIKKFKNPDKTIDVLDEVCAHANLKDTKNINRYNYLVNKLEKVSKKKNDEIKNKNFKLAYEYKKRENNIISDINELDFALSTYNYTKVTLEDVYEVISNKTNIPIKKIKNNDNYKYLETILNKKIIGQESAIKKLINSYRENIGLNRCFSLLFTGPSGVGKTFTALEFAKIISKNIIKLDGREYSDAQSINKLIGVPLGYSGCDSTNYLFNKVIDNPFSVIIFDGLEKFDSSILDLIYQILENNEINDSKGNKIYFNNCVIIFISDKYSNQSVGFNKVSKRSDYFTKKHINRFDEIITFNNLNTENIIKIIESKVNDNSMVSEIMCKVNYEQNGAKEIEKLIKKYENSKKIKKICKNYSKN